MLLSSLKGPASKIERTRECAVHKDSAGKLIVGGLINSMNAQSVKLAGMVIDGVRSNLNNKFTAYTKQ